jgi:hypothetical protein
MMQFGPAPARGGIPMKTTLLFRRFSSTHPSRSPLRPACCALCRFSPLSRFTPPEPQ